MNSLAPLGKAMRWILRAGVMALAASAALLVSANLRNFPRTEDAQIRANVAGVAAQVGGTIVRIAVVDNQRVGEGDLLFELDSRPYEAEAARARARLELVGMEVRALAQAIREAEARVIEMEARHAYALSHYKRLLPLLDNNLTSADRVERARAEADAAAAVLEESRASVRRAADELGEIEGRNTRVEEARAALLDAELRVSFCRVTAPCDGVVTNLQIAPGSYAPAGGQVFTLVDTSQWFALANFRETDLARIQPGQEAEVFLMGDRKRPLRGVVEGIASAVVPLDGVSRSLPGGEGVLSRVEPTFDFVQLATRFPVRISLDPASCESLRMGGKAAVVVRVGAPDSDSGADGKLGR